MAALVGVHIKTVGELIKILEKYNETQELRVISNINSKFCTLSVAVHPTNCKIMIFPEISLLHRRKKDND